jgi:hypothetical protein
VLNTSSSAAINFINYQEPKERLVEFVEAINDIPSMYQRCKVYDNTLLGGRMALENTGAVVKNLPSLATLSKKTSGAAIPTNEVPTYCWKFICRNGSTSDFR